MSFRRLSTLLTFLAVGAISLMGIVIFTLSRASTNSAPEVCCTPQSPLTLADTTFEQKHIPILMYHYIGPVPSDQSKNLVRKDLTVSAENFEAQLQWLSKNNFKTLSLEKTGTVPQFVTEKKLTALTFDDGYDDVYYYAFPLLKKYGFTGTFAIITNRIGTPGYLSADQIKEMATDGMEIVSHSVTHRDLTKLSEADLDRELADSKLVLEKLMNKTVSVFIYPLGAINDTVAARARAAGYVAARTIQEGNVGLLRDPLRLPTVRIRGATSLQKFSELLTQYSQ